MPRFLLAFAICEEAVYQAWRRQPSISLSAAASCYTSLTMSLQNHLATVAVEEPSESAEGVDLTLIQWMLSLAPLERLAVLQDWVDGLSELRRGRIVEP